jgi:hypothetical protein
MFCAVVLPPTLVDNLKPHPYNPDNLFCSKVHSPPHLKPSASRVSLVPIPNPTTIQGVNMPSPPIYTLVPPIHNHVLHRLFESEHTMYAHPLIAISRNILAIVFLSPRPGSFIASVRGSRYTIVGHPVAVFRSRLATALAYLSHKRRCLMPE